MKHTLEEVLSVISGEREYQEQRWPGHVHGVGAYMTYMWHYYREAEKQDSTTDGTLLIALDPIRKVAALGVACMEQNGITPRGGSYREGPASRELVYIALCLERTHQAKMWPESQSMEVSEELTIMRRYLACADESWVHNVGDAKALDELRKVVAVAIRCMQNNGAPERQSASSFAPTYRG